MLFNMKMNTVLCKVRTQAEAALFNTAVTDQSRKKQQKTTSHWITRIGATQTFAEERKETGRHLEKQ